MGICNMSLWRNNEVKCAIIKIQKANAADDYERILNYKWSIQKLDNNTLHAKKV